MRKGQTINKLNRICSMSEGDKENIVRGIGIVLGGVILDRVATKGGI